MKGYVFHKLSNEEKALIEKSIRFYSNLFEMFEDEDIIDATLLRINANQVQKFGGSFHKDEYVFYCYSEKGFRKAHALTVFKLHKRMGPFELICKQLHSYMYSRWSLSFLYFLSHSLKKYKIKTPKSIAELDSSILFYNFGLGIKSYINSDFGAKLLAEIRQTIIFEQAPSILIEGSLTSDDFFSRQNQLRTIVNDILTDGDLSEELKHILLEKNAIKKKLFKKPASTFNQVGKELGFTLDNAHSGFAKLFREHLGAFYNSLEGRDQKLSNRAKIYFIYDLLSFFLKDKYPDDHAIEKKLREQESFETQNQVKMAIKNYKDAELSWLRK